MAKTRDKFDIFLEKLEPHLDRVGLILQKEILPDFIGEFTYKEFARFYKKALDLMVEQKKARKEKAGVYVIVKPNKRQRPAKSYNFKHSF